MELTFDPDHDAVGVVFKDSNPVVLTDDVKIKFYCSNVSLDVAMAMSSSDCVCLFSYRNLCPLALISASFIFGSILPSYRTTGQQCVCMYVCMCV